MNTSCGCLGSLAAASVVPVKRYNQLVPALFPDGGVSPDQPMDPAVAKQINKLLEYMVKNPQRGAKVSRRLARRLQTALLKRQWGLALLVARTYEALLTGLPLNDAPLLAWELVAMRVSKGNTVDAIPPGGMVAAARQSVIGSLLNSPRDDLHTAAAQLLAEFAARQNNCDYLQQLDAFAQHLISFLSGFTASPAAGAASAATPVCSARLAVASINALNAIDSMAARVHMLLSSQVEAVSAVVVVYAAGSPSHAAAGTLSSEVAAIAPSANTAVAATEFVTSYSARSETVLGARKRFGNLFAAAAMAGLWSTSLTAQPFMAAVRQGMMHQFQLHFAYVMLTRHAATLDPVQQQVAFAAAASLWEDMDPGFLSAVEDLKSGARILGVNSKASAAGTEPAQDRQDDAAGSSGGIPARSLQTTASLQPAGGGSSNDNIAAVPAVRNEAAVAEDSSAKYHQSPSQAAQVAANAPEVTLDKWLTLMGVPAMSNEPPPWLFDPVAA